MLKIAKNLRYYFICGPRTILLLMNLTLLPAQRFEFDMPGLDDTKLAKNTNILKKIIKHVFMIWRVLIAYRYPDTIPAFRLGFSLTLLYAYFALWKFEFLPFIEVILHMIPTNCHF
jgi:hypothetical protein